MIGNKGYVYQAKWPEYDEAKTILDEVEVAVQTNGKTRVVIKLPREVSKEDAIKAAKEALGDKANGTIVKEIYVPGKIVNIVVKPN